VAAAAVGLAAPRVRRRLGLKPALVAALAWQAPIVVAAAFAPSRARDAWVYALQEFAYFAMYEMPGDDLDRLRRRVRIHYPITADRVLGLGEVPTTWLQRRFYEPGRLRGHDMALSAFHWVWYFVPHGAVVAVMCRRPERLPRAAATVALTFDLGLLVYRLVPTAPPWWAAEQGLLPPVERIVVRTSERAFGPAWPKMYGELARNPFAAMPSLHMASSWAAAHALGELGPGARAAGFAYSAGLGLALVYLGEHYVVDLLAGVALAESARAIVRSRPFALVAGPRFDPPS
jgi:membrane-associated phospholipid phosphatase